jgi:hypothetical protein
MERGQVVASGADVLIEHAAFAQAVLGRINHLVASGQATPTVRDGLAAATLLARLEAERPPFDQGDLDRLILAHIAAARDTLPDHLRQAFWQRISDDPLMRDMSDRWDRAYGRALT